MNSRILPLAIALLVSVLLFTACGSIQPPGSGQAEPTLIPTVVSDVNIVAEGRIAPRESVQLSFFTNGQVAEVLVEEGDLVKTGDVVARLGDREELEAAIANADAELVAAQLALDELYDNIEDARSAALRAVTTANRDVRDAQYQLDNFTVPTNQEDLAAMEAIDVMKAYLDQARDAFEPYKYKSSNNPTREDLKEELDNAQSDYNAAIRRLEYETDLEEAQSSLNEAMADYEMLKDGPDPDAIASAEARITAAEASLAAAQAALDNLELVATIGGTVVEQDLIIGQMVTAGQAVMQIADFSQMYAETDDLTEIEVVDIAVGQNATVIADALPEVEITGTVEKISDISEEKRGDITYTARILLDEIDTRLRWGMTVVITFEE